MKYIAGLTVAGAARAAQVPYHVVRYYARIGLLRPRRDPANGYRLFHVEDLQRLHFARMARQRGFRLGEIALLLHAARGGRARCPEVAEVLQQRLAQQRRRLATVQALCRRLERVLRSWEHRLGAVPRGRDVQRLIKVASGAARFDRIT